jgi:hypothetical protein
MSEHHDVAAHQQAISNHYTIAFPAHPARENDPHYRDFEHYRRAHIDTAVCHFAERRGGDTSECGGGLELHHSHVEFSMQNGVDLALLEHEYPGISNPDEIGAWIESADNLVFLCAKHHRGHGGIHHASASDYEAETFVRGLIS